MNEYQRLIILFQEIVRSGGVVMLRDQVSPYTVREGIPDENLLRHYLDATIAIHFYINGEFFTLQERRSDGLYITETSEETGNVVPLLKTFLKGRKHVSSIPA